LDSLNHLGHSGVRAEGWDTRDVCTSLVFLALYQHGVVSWLQGLLGDRQAREKDASKRWSVNSLQKAFGREWRVWWREVPRRRSLSMPMQRYLDLP
jgi:hypothetical protein